MSKKKHQRKSKSARIHSRTLVVENQGASSWCGLAMIEKAASKLSIWKCFEKHVPERRGNYERIDIAKAAIAGFLSGSRGSALLNGVEQDKALLRDMGIAALPGEKVFCEDLGRFGKGETLEGMNKTLSHAAEKVLSKLEPEDLQIGHGFIPAFGDGTLLEGSPNRKGTIYIKEKGMGLMWGTWMIGPMLVAQHLCAEGEGEKTAMKETRGTMLAVADKLGWRSRLLVLQDSLHGEGPNLDWLEKNGLYGIIGANMLDATKQRLSELPDVAWSDVPEKHRQDGLVEEQVCVAYIQCEGWKCKRRIVGKRFKRDGELLWNHSGIFCNIPPKRLGFVEETNPGYMLEAWKLYSLKMGMENCFKDLLIDLAGHRPPCRETERNRGYYALLSLAYNLARGVDLLCGAPKRRELRKACKYAPRFFRIATLRRHLFALPGFIKVHSRTSTVLLIGGGAGNLAWFTGWWDALARC